MIGILTNLQYEKHWIFKNYYYGIKNVFGDNSIRLIQNVDDLYGIKILFIGDEMFIPNKEIWMKDDFILYCNQNQIKVFIFNNEKIYNSYFTWNEEIQNNVFKFKKLKQFVYDVDDAQILRVGINKTYMSKTFRDELHINLEEKKDKIFFMGNTSCDSYVNRRIFLDELSRRLDIEIRESDKNLGMRDYLNLIGSYKYILSPLGNGNFIPMRYYESLFLNSIPLQQSSSKISSFFSKEISEKKGIFFESIDDLLYKKNQHIHEEIDDYFFENFIQDEIIRFID